MRTTIRLVVIIADLGFKVNGGPEVTPVGVRAGVKLAGFFVRGLPYPFNADRTVPVRWMGELDNGIGVE